MEFVRKIEKRIVTIKSAFFGLQSVEWKNYGLYVKFEVDGKLKEHGVYSISFSNVMRYDEARKNEKAAEVFLGITRLFHCLNVSRPKDLIGMQAEIEYRDDGNVQSFRFLGEPPKPVEDTRPAWIKLQEKLGRAVPGKG